MLTNKIEQNLLFKIKVVLPMFASSSETDNDLNNVFYSESDSDQEQTNSSHTKDELIDFIEDATIKIGMTSLLMIGQCQITRKVYDEDDVVGTIFIGTGTEYPYNSLQYHPDHEWMVDCIRMNLLISDNRKIRPNTLHGTYHNLPQIIKIKRSSGTIQDALTTFNSKGLRFRVSHTFGSQTPQIYVGVNFFENISSIKNTKETIETLTSYKDWITKDIPIEQLVELNPTLLKQSLHLRFYNITYRENLTTIQKEVIDYFNNVQYLWCENYLQPILDEYKKNEIINCFYTIE